MQTLQLRWTADSGWKPYNAKTTDATLAAAEFAGANLVMAFADTARFAEPACYDELQTMVPNAHIVGCSSAGSVLNTTIGDNDIVATAIRLERGRIDVVTADVDNAEDVIAVARNLMDRLRTPDIGHVFVLCDGLLVNGSELAKGFNGCDVSVTGGLAGDGTRFGKTLVMADAPARSNRIAAIGWYGDITVKSGCFAGWQEFGAKRVVTKSVGNVVYEIDNQPALDLYKKYLGDQARELPSSGLRFPLSVQMNAEDQPVIRTLLAVDEDKRSLTFAGDLPQGGFCRLMKAKLDDLIDSAGLAAEQAKMVDGDVAGLCLIVSCVGRRLVLGQLTEEELETIRDKLGAVAMTGFYSYGELAPFSKILQCELHNQTMTLTAIYE